MVRCVSSRNAGLLRINGVVFVEWEPPGPESHLHPLLRSLLGSSEEGWTGGKDCAIYSNGVFRTHHQLDSLEVEALRGGLE